MAPFIDMTTYCSIIIKKKILIRKNELLTEINSARHSAVHLLFTVSRCTGFRANTQIISDHYVPAGLESYSCQ